MGENDNGTAIERVLKSCNLAGAPLVTGPPLLPLHGLRGPRPQLLPPAPRPGTGPNPGAGVPAPDPEQVWGHVLGLGHVAGLGYVLRIPETPPGHRLDERQMPEDRSMPQVYEEQMGEDRQTAACSCKGHDQRATRRSTRATRAPATNRGQKTRLTPETNHKRGNETNDKYTTYAAASVLVGLPGTARSRRGVCFERKIGGEE